MNAQTGAKLWSIALSYGTTSPAVANGVVYFGSDDGYLYALNAQTGTQLWFAVNPLTSAPVVVNGILYICPQHQNRNVYAYALPPGKQLQPSAQPNPATLRPNLTLSVQP